MDFLGGVNVLFGEARGARAQFGGLELPWAGTEEGSVRAFIRGPDLLLRPDSLEPVSLPVTVERIRRVGVAARVHLDAGAHGVLTAELPHHELVERCIAPGARLHAHVRSARIFPLR
jgi:ABC-type sulfate/molybdate transport systems ATPase subunit